MLSAFPADSLIRISLPFLFVKNFFTFLSYFFSDNILYIKPFPQHYLHQLLVHYAHKHLWQIKSHSYLMNGFSGEDGIRTHAPVRQTAQFQDRPLKPLQYLSAGYFVCRTSDLIILSSRCDFVNSFLKVFLFFFIKYIIRMFLTLFCTRCFHMYMF